MKKLLLCIIIGMFFISMTSGLDTLKPAKLNQEYTILQTCATCTYVNISISNSSGLILTNQPMTNNGSGVWTYDLTPVSLGRYDVTGKGDLGGVDTSFATYFDVTPIGITQTTSQGLGSLGFLILMLFVTIILGYAGFRLSTSKYLWILGIFFLFLSLLMIIYDVWLGYEYHSNFTGMSDSSMPETIFYIFMFILVSGILVSLGLIFLKWKDLYRYIKGEIKNPERDDEFDNDWK